MNLNALVEILNKTTRVVDATLAQLPAKRQLAPNGWRHVDFPTVSVAVSVAESEEYHDRLVLQLRSWPAHVRGPEAGMSYYDALEVLQEPGSVYRLFALGEVLEIWEVTRPTEFARDSDPLRQVDTAQARRLAVNGAIVVKNFRAELRRPPQSVEEARTA